MKEFVAIVLALFCYDLLKAVGGWVLEQYKEWKAVRAIRRWRGIVK